MLTRNHVRFSKKYILVTFLLHIKTSGINRQTHTNTFMFTIVPSTHNNAYLNYVNKRPIILKTGVEQTTANNATCKF